MGIYRDLEPAADASDAHKQLVSGLESALKGEALDGR
jgi:hypothetical protein